MLKRKMGLAFLALLLITGLAGAIHNSSISRSERRNAMSVLKETKSEVLTSVKGLSEEQLNFKNAVNQESILAYFNKIINCEKNIWKLLTDGMKAPASPEKRNEIKIKDAEIVDLFASGNYQCMDLATEGVEKATTKKLSDAFLIFNTVHTRHIKYMKSTTEDMRNHFVSTPIGMVDCYQLCLIMNAQTMKYIDEIKRIKNDPQFPTK